jgi:hypothetical protein
MKRITSLFALVACPLFAWGQSSAPLRVDLNPDIARSDILSPGWESWKVKDGTQATATFGGVTFTLSGSLKTDWFKTGAEPDARVASDGVVCNGPLTLTIKGLSPGRHSLATFHNGYDGVKRSTVTLIVGDAKSTCVPTVRAKTDADVPAAFVTFDAAVAVVVTLTPTAGESVVLNGFELDFSDPDRRATRPLPANGDEHAVETPSLAWAAPAGAKSFRVYVGTDREAVRIATPTSPEFRGTRPVSNFETKALKPNTHDTYFWRIDTADATGTVTPGELWRFRVRQLAFPGAEGYGRFARGGRGGKVYEVTNLNDSGPGSLREAVEATGPRTAVFRVGGVIELKSRLVIKNPYLTVAGQTAPGDGICVKNYTFGASDTHDCIVRHVRIRVGDDSGLTNDGCGARASDHMIFDHCSISWSIDEGFSSREGKNITVQWCVISEALNIANHKKYVAGKGHSFAASISGDVGSFHHNLLAHCTGRNWSLAGGLDRAGTGLAGKLDLRNNVIYNWRDRTTDGGVKELNFVNNLYLPGPATKVFTLLKPDPGDPARGMKAFMAGNRIEGKPAIEADNWSAYVGPKDGMALVKSETPRYESYVKTDSVEVAYERVLNFAGATLPRRDPVDARAVADCRGRTHTFTGSKGNLPGIIDSPKDAGGCPAYRSGPAPVDSDHDGLPDEWETNHKLNPRNPADGSAIGQDGFSNLDRYLNDLCPPVPYAKAIEDPAYRATVAKRATDAVAAAMIADDKLRASAHAAVEAHYFGIKDAHAKRDEGVKAANGDKAQIQSARDVATAEVMAVNGSFLKLLKSTLSADQAEAIQDKMTYDVRPTTFRVYCEMLPNLTDDEKVMIRKHLLRARDEALVAGSADEKHEKFRLAKGRIGNDLSARGYDLKRASDEWAAKRKKAKP